MPLASFAALTSSNDAQESNAHLDLFNTLPPSLQESIDNAELTIISAEKPISTFVSSHTNNFSSTTSGQIIELQKAYQTLLDDYFILLAEKRKEASYAVRGGREGGGGSFLLDEGKPGEKRKRTEEKKEDEEEYDVSAVGAVIDTQKEDARSGEIISKLALTDRIINKVTSLVRGFKIINEVYERALQFMFFSQKSQQVFLAPSLYYNRFFWYQYLTERKRQITAIMRIFVLEENPLYDSMKSALITTEFIPLVARVIEALHTIDCSCSNIKNHNSNDSVNDDTLPLWIPFVSRRHTLDSSRRAVSHFLPTAATVAYCNIYESAMAELTPCVSVPLLGGDKRGLAQSSTAITYDFWSYSEACVEAQKWTELRFILQNLLFYKDGDSTLKIKKNSSCGADGGNLIALLGKMATDKETIVNEVSTLQVPLLMDSRYRNAVWKYISTLIRRRKYPFDNLLPRNRHTPIINTCMLLPLSTSLALWKADIAAHLPQPPLPYDLSSNEKNNNLLSSTPLVRTTEETNSMIYFRREMSFYFDRIIDYYKYLVNQHQCKTFIHEMVMLLIVWWESSATPSYLLHLPTMNTIDIAGGNNETGESGGHMSSIDAVNTNHSEYEDFSLISSAQELCGIDDSKGGTTFIATVFKDAFGGGREDEEKIRRAEQLRVNLTNGNLDDGCSNISFSGGIIRGNKSLFCSILEMFLTREVLWMLLSDALRQIDVTKEFTYKTLEKDQSERKGREDALMNMMCLFTFVTIDGRGALQFLHDLQSQSVVGDHDDNDYIKNKEKENRTEKGKKSIENLFFNFSNAAMSAVVVEGRRNIFAIVGDALSLSTITDLIVSISVCLCKCSNFYSAQLLIYYGLINRHAIHQTYQELGLKNSPFVQKPTSAGKDAPLMDNNNNNNNVNARRVTRLIPQELFHIGYRVLGEIQQTLVQETSLGEDCQTTVASSSPGAVLLGGKSNPEMRLLRLKDPFTNNGNLSSSNDIWGCDVLSFSTYKDYYYINIISNYSCSDNASKGSQSAVCVEAWMYVIDRAVKSYEEALYASSPVFTSGGAEQQQQNQPNQRQLYPFPLQNTVEISKMRAYLLTLFEQAISSLLGVRALVCEKSERERALEEQGAFSSRSVLFAKHLLDQMERAENSNRKCIGEFNDENQKIEKDAASVVSVSDRNILDLFSAYLVCILYFPSISTGIAKNGLEGWQTARKHQPAATKVAMAENTSSLREYVTVTNLLKQAISNMARRSSYIDSCDNQESVSTEVQLFALLCCFVIAWHARKESYAREENAKRTSPTTVQSASLFLLPEKHQKDRFPTLPIAAKKELVSLLLLWGSSVPSAVAERRGRTLWGVIGQSQKSQGAYYAELASGRKRKSGLPSGTMAMKRLGEDVGKSHSNGTGSDNGMIDLSGIANGGCLFECEQAWDMGLYLLWVIEKSAIKKGTVNYETSALSHLWKVCCNSQGGSDDDVAKPQKEAMRKNLDVTLYLFHRVMDRILGVKEHVPAVFMNLSASSRIVEEALIVMNLFSDSDNLVNINEKKEGDLQMVMDNDSHNNDNETKSSSSLPGFDSSFRGVFEILTANPTREGKGGNTKGKHYPFVDEIFMTDIMITEKDKVEKDLIYLHINAAQKAFAQKVLSDAVTIFDSLFAAGVSGGCKNSPVQAVNCVTKRLLFTHMHVRYTIMLANDHAKGLKSSNSVGFHRERLRMIMEEALMTATSLKPLLLGLKTSTGGGVMSSVARNKSGDTSSDMSIYVCLECLSAALLNVLLLLIRFEIKYGTIRWPSVPDLSKRQTNKKPVSHRPPCMYLSDTLYYHYDYRFLLTPGDQQLLLLSLLTSILATRGVDAFRGICYYWLTTITDNNAPLSSLQSGKNILVTTVNSTNVDVSIIAMALAACEYGGGGNVENGTEGRGLLNGRSFLTVYDDMHGIYGDFFNTVFGSDDPVGEETVRHVDSGMQCPALSSLMRLLQRQQKRYNDYITRVKNVSQYVTDPSFLVSAATARLNNNEKCGLLSMDISHHRQGALYTSLIIGTDAAGCGSTGTKEEAFNASGAATSAGFARNGVPAARAVFEHCYKSQRIIPTFSVFTHRLSLLKEHEQDGDDANENNSVKKDNNNHISEKDSSVLNHDLAYVKKFILNNNSIYKLFWRQWALMEEVAGEQEQQRRCVSLYKSINGGSAKGE